MTTRKLLNELYSLEIHDLTKFLTKHHNGLLTQPIDKIVEEVGKISKKLSGTQQEQVETILAYALCKTENDDEADFEYDSGDDPGVDFSTATSDVAQKRHDERKHLDKKRDAIQHGMKNISNARLQNPNDPALEEKCSSLKKQQHILKRKS